MFNPNILPPDRPRRNNRRFRNIPEQLRDRILNQNPIALLFMGMSLLTLLIQSLPYVLAGIYVVLAWLSVFLWASLDLAFGSRLVGEVPALMWMLWGAVFGACGAFWLSAPLYGWRNKRALLLLVPILLMVVTSLIINLKKPLPTQPNLLETATVTTQPNTANP